MSKHENFKKGSLTFDLSHLDPISVDFIRPATEKNTEKKYKVWVSFSDHCFTDHFAKNDDIDWLYKPSYTERYFCTDRYQHSKGLMGVLHNLALTNPYIGKTFNQHREQYYHLEANILDIDYSVFFEIDKNNNPANDLRIKIVSAYEKAEWSQAVSTSSHHKFWSVLDSKVNNTKLKMKRRR